MAVVGWVYQSRAFPGDFVLVHYYQCFGFQSSCFWMPCYFLFFNRWLFVGSGGTLWWMGKGWGGHQQNCIGYANMQNQSCLFWPPIIATKNALLHCTTFLQKKSRVFQPLRLLKHIIALHSLSSGWFNMNIDLDMIYMKYKQYRGLNTDSRY